MAIPPLEFVEYTEGPPITEVEAYERVDSPNVVGRDLLDLLLRWERKAISVVSEHGFSISKSTPTCITSWRHDIKTAAPPEVKDAWSVLIAIHELRWNMNPCGGYHEAFLLARAGIRLGLAIGKAHTRPFTKPAAIGKAVMQGGECGAINKHGNQEERKMRYIAMRHRYKQLRGEQPDWGHYKLTNQIGKEFGISGRRVRDHVKKL